MDSKDCALGLGGGEERGRQQGKCILGKVWLELGRRIGWGRLWESLHDSPFPVSPPNCALGAVKGVGQDHLLCLAVHLSPHLPFASLRAKVVVGATGARG